MNKAHTAYNAHPLIKKALAGLVDLPDDAMSYSFKLLPKEYELIINYHDKESLVIKKPMDSKIIYDALNELFVNLPDSASLVSFDVCPDKAFTLNVEYLAEFK